VASVCTVLPDLLEQPTATLLWGSLGLVLALGSWFVPRRGKAPAASLDVVDAIAFALLAGSVTMNWEALLAMSASLWFRSVGSPRRYAIARSALYVASLFATHAVATGVLRWEDAIPTLSIVPIWFATAFVASRMGAMLREHDSIAAIREVESKFGACAIAERTNPHVREHALESWDTLRGLVPGLTIATGELADGQWRAMGIEAPSTRVWHLVPRPDQDVERQLMIAVPQSVSARQREACIDTLARIELIVQHTKDHLLITERALSDDLTGLSNRAGFFAALAPLESQRAELGVLFFDLDRLKAVNDTLGHGVGDEVLRAAASRIRTACAGATACARLGGDEFAAIFPHGDADALRLVGADVTAAFDVPIITPRGPVDVGVSWGVSTVTDGDVTALLASADAAMYSAKRAQNEAGIVTRFRG